MVGAGEPGVAGRGEGAARIFRPASPTWIGHLPARYLSAVRQTAEHRWFSEWPFGQVLQRRPSTAAAPAGQQRIAHGITQHRNPRLVDSVSPARTPNERTAARDRRGVVTYSTPHRGQLPAVTSAFVQLRGRPQPEQREQFLASMADQHRRRILTQHRPFRYRTPVSLESDRWVVQRQGRVWLVGGRGSARPAAVTPRQWLWMAAPCPAARPRLGERPIHGRVPWWGRYCTGGGHPPCGPLSSVRMLAGAPGCVRETVPRVGVAERRDPGWRAVTGLGVSET